MKSSADMYEIFTQTDNDEYEEALGKISSLEAEIQDRAATENNLNEEVSSWKEQTKQVEQKMKEQDEFYAEKLTTLQKDFNEVRFFCVSFQPSSNLLLYRVWSWLSIASFQGPPMLELNVRVTSWKWT